MNRVEITERVQNYLPNATYYKTVDFNDSIKDGYDEIACHTGCIFASATLPYIANKTFYDFRALLPNYIGVIGIFSSPIKRWLWPTSLTKLALVRWDWETAVGSPLWFVPVSHRFVAIFMKPGISDYGNMQIFYRCSPPLDISDTDEIQIPDAHIQALDSYVVTDLLEQNQEFSKALSYYKSSYQPDLEKLKLYIESKRNVGRQQRLMD